MAVPKRKTSNRLNKATVVECPQCHEPKEPHRICRNCGYYKNREVISVD